MKIPLFYRVHRLLLILVWALAGASWAVTVEVGPLDNIQAQISVLGPGDTLLLRGGVYIRDTSWFLLDLNGTLDSPIVIRNKPGEIPHLEFDTLYKEFVHISLGGAGQNIITLGRSSHLILEGLELTGGRTGIETYYGLCHDITIRNCHIHDVGNVGIRIASNGHYNFSCYRNHIHHTGLHGEGYYIGDSPGSVPADGNPHHCEFAGNWIHHTATLTPESQGDGIELKSGCYAMTVRDNVIHDTKNPCILSWGTAGRPMADNNRVFRNVVFHSNDAGMQINAETDVFNNLMLGGNRKGSKGLNVHENLTSATTLRQVRVCNNTLFGTRLRLGNLFNKEGLFFANNAVYYEGDTAVMVTIAMNATLDTFFSNNRVSGAVAGTVYRPAGFVASRDGARAFSDPLAFDFYPGTGSELIGTGATLAFMPFGFQSDFNGTARGPSWDVGAYQFAAGVPQNSGWTLDSLSGEFMDTLGPATRFEEFLASFDNPGPFLLHAGPNPFCRFTELTWTGLSDARLWNPLYPADVRIFDSRGRMVLKTDLRKNGRSNERLMVDGAAIGPGVYMAEIRAGGRGASLKLFRVR